MAGGFSSAVQTLVPSSFISAAGAGSDAVMTKDDEDRAARVEMQRHGGPVRGGPVERDVLVRAGVRVKEFRDLSPTRNVH